MIPPSCTGSTQDSHFSRPVWSPSEGLKGPQTTDRAPLSGGRGTEKKKKNGACEQIWRPGHTEKT